MKYFFSFIAVFGSMLCLAQKVEARVIEPGELIKGSTPAVYYYTDGKRYVFPTEAVYMSWYKNFDTINTVADDTLAKLPLGGNVTFQPGSMVKLTTDPKVYLVEEGNTLRWIETEEAAKQLYGDGWASMVKDISDAYFVDYKIGESVPNAEGWIAGLLPSAYYNYQTVLDKIRDDKIEAGELNGSKTYADFAHPDYVELTKLMPHGYEGKTDKPVADLRQWYLNNSTDWQLLYDKQSSNATATMAVLNFSKKTANWFTHRSVIIADTVYSEQQEVIFHEIDYPEGYIVYPYGATASYDQGEFDIRQGILTYASKDEVNKWYNEVGYTNGWPPMEQKMDFLGLVTTYSTNRDDTQRALQVNFLAMDQIEVLPPLNLFSVEYLKTIR
ncbi:MAG: hypothetical protein ACOYUZ_00220 [Patescibacteria group bacterium]